MAILRLFFLITYFALVYAHIMPHSPFKINNIDKKYLFKPLKHHERDESVAWSEMVVIKMHYDCEGLLIRQELSKVRTRAGAIRVPGEEEHGVTEEERETEPATMAPVYFRSMRERFKTARTREAPATTTPTITAPTTTAPTTTAPTTTVPPTKEELPPIKRITPDRIIDTPRLSCKEGYNEVPTGGCRLVRP